MLVTDDPKVSSSLPSPSRPKKARFAGLPTQRSVRPDDFCITAPHPYGILPSGNRLFDTYTTETSASASASSNTLLSSINDECWYNVLEFCDGPTLARVSQTCRFFYAAAHEPSLWRDLVLRRQQSNNNTIIDQAGPSWKDCFVRMAMSDYNHVDNKTTFVLHRPMRMRAVYSDHFHRLHACRNFSIPSQWLQHDVDNDDNSLARIPYDQMTLELFHDKYESCNLPVVIQGAAKHWRAFDKWNDAAYLRDQAAHCTFRATSGTAPLPATFTYKAYEEYCQSPSLEEGPLYLFDRTALQPGTPLWNDYMTDLQQTCPYWDPQRDDTTHDLFQLLGEGRRPDHTWLIVGPKRSGSVFHIDPNATHAWNATIVGRKRWIFYPPGVTPPGVLPSADGDEVVLPLSLGEWLLQFWKAHTIRRRTAPKNERPIEFTAFPGDVVFVPHGWWHLVVNLDDHNIAITHNYVSDSNLPSVLKFLRDKNDQVSGCRDRDDSIKPDDLYSAFVSGLRLKHPVLLEKALQDDSWACDAWTTVKSKCRLPALSDRLGNHASETTSVIAKAKDSSDGFLFGFFR